MTREERQQLHRAFATRLSECLPEYARDSTATLPAGGFAYKMRLASAHTAFIVLAAWDGENRFTVECGASNDGQLPRHKLLTKGDDVVSLLREGRRFRLGRIIDGSDRWWRIGPDPRSLLDVTDAEIAAGALTMPPIDLVELNRAVNDVVTSLQAKWQPLCEAL